MNIIQRAKEPTPKFFKELRAIGLILAAVGGAVLAAPMALPAALVSAAGYVSLAGGVITAVSQTAVTKEPDATDEDWPVPKLMRKSDE